MALPPTPRLTELSLFIRTLRSRLGVSQLELVRLLNREIKGEPLPDKYVSIIETGARRSLDERFYQALGKIAGQPADKLKDLHLLPAPKKLGTDLATPRDALAARRVRLGAGHVVWSAPIIAAALEGRLSDLEITTFVDPDPNDPQPSIDRAVWIRSNDWPILPRDLKELARRSPGPNQHPEPLKGEGKTTVPLSANDVLRWLSEEKIDIAAVPGDLIKENRDLMRIGTLVDSAAGCILLCDDPLAQAIKQAERGSDSAKRGSNKRPATQQPYINTNDLSRALDDCKDDLARKHSLTTGEGQLLRHAAPKVAAEAGTIAMLALEKTLDGAAKSSELLKVAWNLRASELMNRTYWSLDAEVDHTLAAVIAWAPHSHWLQRNSNQTHSTLDPANRVECFPLQLSPNELGRPQHLEFDLVILRKNSENPLLKRVFYDLIWKTWQAAQEIGQMRPGAFHKHLEPLAAYFDLGDWGDVASMADVVSHAIGGVRFSVSLDIENQHEFIQR